MFWWLKECRQSGYSSETCLNNRNAVMLLSRHTAVLPVSIRHTYFLFFIIPLIINTRVLPTGLYCGRQTVSGTGKLLPHCYIPPALNHFSLYRTQPTPALLGGLVIRLKLCTVALIVVVGDDSRKKSHYRNNMVFQKK